MQGLLDNWLFLLVVGLLTVVIWRLQSRPRGIPPGPRGWPIVGNLFHLTDQLHLDCMKLGKTYGDVFSLYFGNKLTIILNNSKVIKEAFVTMGTTFADRHASVILNKENGAGIFSEPFGDNFARQKKFALKAMCFAGYGSKIAEVRMLSAIDEVSNYLVKQGSKPIEMIGPIHKGTAKVICAILFSKEHAWDDQELETLIKRVNDLIQAFNSNIFFADLLPKILIPPIFGKRLKQLFDQIQTIINSYCMKRVEEHRSTYDPDNLRDFVDYYMKGDEGGPFYNDQELATLCWSFFADAIDTTGYQILWNIFFLAKFPEWQRKLQEEIDVVLGSSKEPTSAEKIKLPRTEAFLWEGMRMASIASQTFPHKPIKDTTLCGYYIPKNASVIANLWAVNRDPKIWPEPEKFRPERHIDSNGQFIKTDNIIIFGQGRRMCIAEQLVKTENYMFLVRLLQRFTFKFPNDEKGPEIEDAEDSVIRRPPQFKICAIPR